MSTDSGSYPADNMRTAQLEYEGRVYSFELCERVLNFGSAGGGRYFWMDGRQFRRGRVNGNFRECVDLWWSGVEQHDGVREAANESNLVLAECYPRVATSRAMQHVFVDAHLHATADREYEVVEDPAHRHVQSERMYNLPIDECDRIRSVAHSRDVHRIRMELENLFLGEQPPEEEIPAYQEAAQAWIGNGIRALRVGGRGGLQEYVGTVDEWIRRLRRQGRQQRVRLFLDMFAYECKVAFYRCYARAWQQLLQWHEHYFQPEVVGRRFLSVWHAQNQACENLDESRDAFCGQVLALHPLSGIVLSSSEHLAAIGHLLELPDFEEQMRTGEILHCSNYWDFVATILIAAHEYDYSRRTWDATRGTSTASGTNILEEQPRDDAPPPHATLFEDFAVARGHTCPECQQSLRYRRHQLPETGEEVVTVFYECSHCGGETTVDIPADDFAPGWESEDDDT